MYRAYFLLATCLLLCPFAGRSARHSAALTGPRSVSRSTRSAALTRTRFALVGPADSLAPRMASTVMTLWPDSMTKGRPARWNYEQGVVLKGMEAVWRTTGDPRYLAYIRHVIDPFITPEGDIRTYKYEDFTLDNINTGRSLLLLYKETGDNKYEKAAEQLMEQIRHQPRTSEGGFWHKKTYPGQMWLDGLYMAEPFYAEYAAMHHEDSVFEDIEKQFVLMEKHARDPKTGLLYHGWDESKREKWADPATGVSPSFWSRSMGWYGAGLVDALDYFPKNHPGRKTLLAILRRYAEAVQAVQDPATGLWWDVLNYPGRDSNYLEASGSCLFVYILAKAARKGYLPASYLAIAQKGYEGIVRKFISTGPDGQVNLEGTVNVGGLGGNSSHYRDGSYAYYMSERIVANDPKGIGAFLLASCAIGGPRP